MSETAGQDGTTIFTNESGVATSTTTTPAPTVPNVVLPDEVKDFVGEGKKYATIEDALKSVPHAQKYIDEQKAKLAELEEESQKLKEELAKKKQMEEYLESLKQTNTEPSQTVQTPDISSLVEQKITELEHKKKATQNLMEVDAAMKKQYGEKAKEIFATKANELGVSIAYLTNLASTSPNAFYKMFDIKDGQNSGMKTNSSINTESLSGTQSNTQSARINKIGATTKDMVTAWNAARPKQD